MTSFASPLCKKKGLVKLGIVTVENLLRYFPTRYTSIADIKHIADLAKGDTATIYGRVVSSKTSKGSSDAYRQTKRS